MRSARLMRSGRPSQEPSSPPRKQRLERLWRAAAEELESRTLLTSVVSGAIPNQITPSSAPQALFAPGTDQFALNTTAGFRVVGSQSYRFSVAGAQSSVVTTFATTANTPELVDTALALFDSDGNLLQTADADAGGLFGNESLAATLQSGRPYVLGDRPDGQ